MEKLKVGLFIPCYVNQLYPQVAIATLQLLEKLDVEVYYPQGQTCCGQPLGNSGYEEDSKGACKLFVNINLNGWPKSLLNITLIF